MARARTLGALARQPCAVMPHDSSWQRGLADTGSAPIPRRAVRLPPSRTSPPAPTTHHPPRPLYVSMPSPRIVRRTPRTRWRETHRITRDVALILSNLRRFFEAEKAARGPTMLNQPTLRVVRAAGVSRNTVTRVGQDGWANARPASGDPERRASKRRIPVKELSHVRAAVYDQYKNRAIPTLDRTLGYMEVIGGERRCPSQTSATRMRGRRGRQRWRKSIHTRYKAP